MIVGVESDKSMFNLYGTGYPLNKQKTRLDFLSELNIVDLCFGFEDILDANTSDKHFVKRYVSISPHEVAIPKWDANFIRKIKQIRDARLTPRILDIRIYRYW